MLGTSFTYSLIIFTCIQTSVFFWQLINYFFRSDDPSRLRFLLLITGFLCFNLINLVTHKVALSESVEATIVHGTGFVLAAYFVLYLIREFNGFQTSMAKNNSLLFILAGSVMIGALAVYLFKDNFKLVKNLLMVFPLLAAITYCTALEIDLRRKGSSAKTGNRYLLIYSGYAGIIYITANPVLNYLGIYYALNVSLINILFLLTVCAYVHQLIVQERNEIQARAREELTLADNDLSKYRLTRRELQIAYLILQNIDYDEIAERLCITYKTLTKHASNIFGKTNIVSRTKEEFIEKFSQK